MKKLFAAMLMSCLGGLPNTAQAAADQFTEIGLYVFAAGIEGDTQFRNVEAEIDASFSDIVENLDAALMGYAEHRRNKWSFILDGLYTELSDDSSATNRILTISLDATLKQAMVEGVVGYRVLENSYTGSKLGIDLLGGARFNSMEVDLGLQASALGLTAAGSRKRNEEWVDGIVGVRAQYGHQNGWGVTGWADAGTGSDSHSYQLLGVVNYSFENNVKIFGGYRHYDFQFEDGAGNSFFEIDAAMSGPLVGVSYRF